MISARTTLRLPVAGSVIIPNLPKSASATSTGSVSDIRTVRTQRLPQFRFRMNRRNEVHHTVQSRAANNSWIRATFNRSPVSHW